jgi:hypothetical protein
MAEGFVFLLTRAELLALLALDAGETLDAWLARHKVRSMPLPPRAPDWERGAIGSAAAAAP